MVEEVILSGELERIPEREWYSRIILRRISFLITCLILLFALFGLSISVGSADLSLREVYAALLKGILLEDLEVSELAETVVWHLRLPRALMAALCGAVLSMSGCVVMAVLRNPLATPYTLGVSSGAGLGAAIAIILGGRILLGTPIIVGNAFVLSLIPILIILLVSKRGWTSSPETMILMGVAMSYIFSATNTLLQFIAESEAVRTTVFWLVGDLSRAAWWQVPYTAGVMILSLLIYERFAWDLNAMKMGDETAKGLGIDVDNVRRLILMTACLSTATVVSFTGAIGFICLLAPHITRIVVGEDEQYLIPISGVFGADLLLISDIIARKAVAPIMLPVGVITALLGGPMLLYLLLRRG
ncbi:MAG: iron ABC transporter permease [Candidatus Korarchaeum sp.]|nr:iron ABC transporter permease [Candidatus Korarchaeum sp.]